MTIELSILSPSLPLGFRSEGTILDIGCSPLFLLVSFPAETRPLKIDYVRLPTQLGEHAR